MNFLRDRVRYARDFSGLTQEQVAQAGNITKSALQGIENGRSTNPKYNTLKAISKVTGFTVDWLMKQETVYDSCI